MSKIHLQLEKEDTKVTKLPCSRCDASGMVIPRGFSKHAEKIPCKVCNSEGYIIGHLIGFVEIVFNGSVGSQPQKPVYTIEGIPGTHFISNIPERITKAYINNELPLDFRYKLEQVKADIPNKKDDDSME